MYSTIFESTNILYYLLKKRECGLQLYKDYCTLNYNTVNNTWLLTWIDELIARLKITCILSELNLKDGYHYIPIDFNY